MSKPLNIIPHLRGIIAFIRNPKTDWKPKAAVVLAILYLVWPIDLFPDLVPILGWLDDIGATTLAIAYLIHAANLYQPIPPDDGTRKQISD